MMMFGLVAGIFLTLQMAVITPVEVDVVTSNYIQGYIDDEEHYWDDMEMLALITMAEAEGESDLGKRLVIDTVLNRVDSDEFPNCICEVINQKGQFESMWNGRYEAVELNDDICSLVMDEINNGRYNSQVLYFTAGGYGHFGTPSFKEGNHYFCTK